MESRGKAALAGIALLAVFAAAYIVRSGGEGDSKPSGQATSESARPPRPRSAQNSPNNSKSTAAKDLRDEGPVLPEKARSLRGTDIDGALRVDPDGKLVLGPDVVRFFEYFLSATGEAGRSIAVPSDDDPLARLDAIKKLRRDHFGDEAASLMFGEEELEGEVAAERSRIMKDPELSPEERDAKLAELEAKLPESAQRANEAATRALRLREDEAALRAKGASEEEIRRHRVEAVGEEAADRLQALDQKRAEWKGRIDAFRAERDRIAKQYSDEAARKAAEERLFEESFDPDERARARAVLSLPQQ
ncbi:MAG: lipase chaperone [Polyangiaceae bacterium]|nr:lipase chaperone [Polyangiaceae bacterium]